MSCTIKYNKIHTKCSKLIYELFPHEAVKLITMKIYNLKFPQKGRKIEILCNKLIK